jgi:hypothetical protein
MEADMEAGIEAGLAVVTILSDILIGSESGLSSVAKFRRGV